MPKQLHHVVMRSHSAKTFIAFLTDVVGMEVQFELRVPGEVLETTLGWPPSDGADVTMVGVPVEFMGAYAPGANSVTRDATNS
jgi:catechol 2,3-dioxygenase-like lactoylglutathione lyase family enzyme